MIQLVPNPPVSLVNIPEVTTDTTIKFSWSDDVNGGAPIIDYDVYYDQGSDNFVLLASGVIDQNY